MLCPYLYGRQSRININSGYTGMMGVVSWEWSVGSGPWGNVELLTLTLSFPSNRKRYNIDKALASCRYLQKWLPTLTPIAKIEDFGMENFC
jgi:hypothetical protein